MPNNHNDVMEPNKSKLHELKSSKKIIQEFSLNDVPQLRKTLLQLVLDYNQIAPDEFADQEFREEVITMYWSLEKLLESIEKHNAEIRYEIERRVG